MKYSDLMLDWLKELGYTKCFYVAGGNIMHLLDSARNRFDCRPFVHEVATVIAAEYFNEVSSEKAFALVTAGPGLTNAVTGFAGAYLESRFVLVIGGQVKSSDLAGDSLRQRGIQEIDGLAIVKPVTAGAYRIAAPISKVELQAMLASGQAKRPGPVFLEMCLDAQGAPVKPSALEGQPPLAADANRPPSNEAWKAELAELIAGARRPVLLLGGGLSRKAALAAQARLGTMNIPVMTTWNGADRIAADHPLYFGRPNTWGQRDSNILLQQADLVLALGTRLGLQQTGFNWQAFAPVGKVVQVDIDRSELEKGHPRVDLPIEADAAAVLDFILDQRPPDTAEWLAFCRQVRETLVGIDTNKTGAAYLDPFAFTRRLSSLAKDEDIIVPCSSGGAFTVMMQAFAQKQGQRMITNKGLASMGYGLSGALGASLAAPDRRVILVEGDGGFAQNLQEIGTAVAMKSNLKIFIFDDNGYASIRMTQRNYFGGSYMGCDTSTGLGLPKWDALFAAYGLPVLRLGHDWYEDDAVRAAFDGPGPVAFLVPVDPEQTYMPKITSRVASGGSMVSNPLHAMSPDLAEPIAAKVFRYMPSPYGALSS
jgi:acetolactate synthase I/II/III large subunit